MLLKLSGTNQPYLQYRSISKLILLFLEELSIRTPRTFNRAPISLIRWSFVFCRWPTTITTWMTSQNIIFWPTNAIATIKTNPKSFQSNMADQSTLHTKRNTMTKEDHDHERMPAMKRFCHKALLLEKKDKKDYFVGPTTNSLSKSFKNQFNTSL